MGESGGETLATSYSESSAEYNLSIASAIFLLILMISIIVSNYVVHRLHWTFLPEAAATIAVGMFASFFFKLEYDQVTTSLMSFDPKIFFVGLLPPIIFNSGYTMKRRYFFENLRPILTYSIGGTFIMSVVTGSLLYGVGRLGWSLKLSLAEALSFGSLISATDTVSTLAVFQELRVDPVLFYLVFGESSLNDAVAICLFQTFSKFIGFTYSIRPLVIALLQFALIFCGSTLLGVGFAMIAALIFKHSNLRSCVLHEVGVYVMFAYIPFLFSQVVAMSGVVAIIFTGIGMKHYAAPNLSVEAQEVCSRVFNTVAHLTEASVFLDLGLSVFGVSEGYDIRFIAWTSLFCMIARACHVYPLTWIVNKKKTHKITSNQQHMIWYAGLRGAVAFALAKSFPGEKQQEITATTMIVILVTIFLMGGGTVSMLNLLEIPRLTPEEELALDKSVRPHKHMKALQFDNKYLIPLLTNLCRYEADNSPLRPDSSSGPDLKGFGDCQNADSRADEEVGGEEEEEEDIINVLRK